LIETATLHSIDPRAYLADILANLVNGRPARKFDERLPWTWAERNRLPLAA
jgi:transposase